jgi:hypothetical protein
MDTLTLYLQQFSDSNTGRTNSKAHNARDILADFHLLRYLAINDIFTFSMVNQNFDYVFFEKRKSLGST